MTKNKDCEMGKFDNVTRRLVLEDFAKGLSVPEICRKYGIKSRLTVFLWRQEARPIREEIISFREVARIKAELAELRLDNEIMVKAGCSANSPKDIRQQAFLRL